jgi:phage terminase large subunit
LRALPPKQALILALTEKARREKIRATRETASQSVSDHGDLRPEFKNSPSLVLDRNHPLSDLYYKKARNKVYWGGRGSAKSWAFAEALVRLASALPLRILCTREFQISIRDSSHKLLKDTITRLGMDSWFIVTDKSIRSRVGAEFIFKGLHGAENGIRSMEGVDIAWVEEAQTVTALSWQSLTPTLRNEGSEVWVSFNLIDENDATYQRFVKAPPTDPNSTVCEPRRPDSIVHKVNYDRNPFFTTVLRNEMEADKASDYHLYEHIWLGMPRKISSAIVLNQKYVVMDFDDELWKEAPRLLYGADFGYSQDPSTLSRMFILPASIREPGARGEDLYISHEAYGSHVETEEYDEFYGDVPGSKEWHIKADAARPETISAIRRRGYAISAAEKWEGSVKDGIQALRSFNKIVIHTRCKHHAREAFLWRWKVDPKQVDDKGQPLVLPILVDKNNHTWDGVRYGLDGYIQRTGAMGMWAKLGQTTPGLPDPSKGVLPGTALTRT